MAAFAVAWDTEDGTHSYASDLGCVESTVNAAELVAVVVAAAASEQAGLNNVQILTDHEGADPGLVGSDSGRI